MNRYWYAVYTRPLKERKVISQLNRRGIENFCPLVTVSEGRGEYKKSSQQPLFKSLVFVNVDSSEIRSLLTVPYVTTLAYWQSSPAVISQREIDIIKKVTETYSDIRLEKTAVEMGADAKVADAPAVEYNEKTISIKYKKVKATLPSLGFIISGEHVKQQPEIIYPQAGGLFTSFPKRINAFFFN